LQEKGERLLDDQYRILMIKFDANAHRVPGANPADLVPLVLGNKREPEFFSPLTQFLPCLDCAQCPAAISDHDFS
jgi:hypothetical protein